MSRGGRWFHACAGLVREIRDPDYRLPGERRRARQLELDLGELAGGAR